MSISTGIQHRRSSGQVLLLGLMLVALITTIVGTGALQTISSTQTTKQTEEARRAANIARGALEAGINDEEIDPGTFFSNVNPDASTQSIVNKTPTNQYVHSDVVQKDGQLLFYLTDFNTSTNTFGSEYYDGGIQVFFGTEGSCPELELLAVGPDNQVIDRKYSGALPGCSGSLNHPDAIAVENASAEPLTWDGNITTFSGKLSLTVNSAQEVRLLVIRPFFGSTKVGFVGVGNDLMSQGREISSTVRTIDGAQRTETVYQAYPQIPLSLFATVL